MSETVGAIAGELTDHNETSTAVAELVDCLPADNETAEGVKSKTCPICKKTLPPNVNLSFHQMLHPWTLKPYSCDHCLYVTISREELNKHCKEQHFPKRKFICPMCGKEFSYARALNKHKHVHAAVLPYICAYCDRGYAESYLWREHELAHKTARYQCPDCKVNFCTTITAASHCEMGTCKTKELFCCEQVFSTRMDYVEHCIHNHRSNLKQFPCKYCKKIYSFQGNLSNHENKCKNRMGKSVRAGATVKQKSKAASPKSAKIGKKNITQGVSKPISSEKGIPKVFQCDICPKTYTTTHLLKIHRLKHTNPDDPRLKHKCQTCGREYNTYPSLFYHKRSVHLKILPHKCSACPKAFMSRQGLRDHQTVHTGDQPYACSYCPRRFSKRRGKQEHERAHTGERPFKCKFCDLTFKRRDNRANHERKHTGEKPFPCRICDRYFRQDASRRSHEKKHGPPYACTLCDQVFTGRDMLALHKNSHIDKQVEEQVEEQFAYFLVGLPEGVAVETYGAQLETNGYVQY